MAVARCLGPTGSGKTALSLALGERFGGEIVSCDSVAVYRGMDLGTAKPTAEERARAAASPDRRCRPGPAFHRGRIQPRAARAALREIAARGRLPIVTGGTGLYLRALTDGLFAGPVAAGRLRDTAQPQPQSAGRRLAAPAAHAARSGIGRAHPRQRHAQADSRHRGVPGGAQAAVGRCWRATRSPASACCASA